MDKLFVEIFGPFIVAGTIYSIVVLVRRLRGGEQSSKPDPEGEPAKEEDSDANGKEDESS